MNAVEKLQEIGDAMKMEAEDDSSSTRLPVTALGMNSGGLSSMPCRPTRTNRAQAKRDALGITQATMPGGKRINLLKTMMTTACERNCYYCSFRAGRNFRRVTFKPEEMAYAFMDMYRAGVAEGLFLSSGIIRGGISSQDKIIETADILRSKLGFKGYIHLKIMPGVERDQIYRSMQLASRVSVNLEAPNAQRLGALAPKKLFLNELMQPLKIMEGIRRQEHPVGTWNGRWASSSTQFVVGAAEESDVELLSTTSYLFNEVSLRRTYFMAFNPVPDTPLENHPAEEPWRQHRLYQAAYLLRDYGFDVEEIPFNQAGRLPLLADPKLAWAKENLLETPIEVNQSDRQLLLRVPGIGPQGVRAIISSRRSGKIRRLEDLKAIGISPGRTAPFILLNGRRPVFQLPLL